MRNKAGRGVRQRNDVVNKNLLYKKQFAKAIRIEAKQLQNV